MLALLRFQKTGQSMHCGTKAAQCHHCVTQASLTLIAPGIETCVACMATSIYSLFVTAQCLKRSQDQRSQMLSDAVRPVVTCRTFVPTDVHIDCIVCIGVAQRSTAHSGLHIRLEDFEAIQCGSQAIPEASLPSYKKNGQQKQPT